MAQKYYNSTETAKLLGVTVDEVKKMLDRRELHGYRDGADWKFRTEQIDELAKQRAATEPPADLAEADSGDVLLSEVELGQSDPGTSGTVIAMEGLGAGVPESDIQLAGSDIKISDEPLPPAAKGSSGRLETLTLDDDLAIDDSVPALKNIAPRDAGSNSSAIDLGASAKILDDDDLVLGGSSASGVAIGGDSGISLVDPADSGISLDQPLELAGSNAGLTPLGEIPTAGAASSGPTTSDSDFLLTPLEEAPDADGSESGSQVIALDTELDEAAAGGEAGASMASMLDEDLSVQPALDMGLGGPLATPVLGAQPAGLADGVAVMQPGASLAEPPYTGWQIAGLAACATVLMLCGMMMYDNLRNMWSWETAFTLNSSLMDLFLGR